MKVSPEEILRKIDKYKEINHDKEKLLNLFNKADPNKCDPKIEDIKETLSYFKNDEEIIGNFARIFDPQGIEYECTGHSSYVEFCLEIDCDYDMLCWIAANNIVFACLTMNEIEWEEYLLYTICSFTEFTHTKDCVKSVIYPATESLSSIAG